MLTDYNHAPLEVDTIPSEAQYLPLTHSREQIDVVHYLVLMPLDCLQKCIKRGIRQDLHLFLFHARKDTRIRIEISTWDDWTSYKPPLTYALQYNHLDIADYLLSSGARLQIAKSGTSGGRPDVLEIACENGSLDTVKWIVDHGYPLDEERVQKSMVGAVRNDHIEVLKYFLTDLKVDINSEYYYSTSLATGVASIETIKFLVDNGADVNGGKARIHTPLDSAVMANRADMVQYLLDNGADADFVGTDDGYTPSRPLTVAIQNGYYDIVKILVEHGADLNNKEGWDSGKDTPLEIAEREKSQHIIDYIKNATNDK